MNREQINLLLRFLRMSKQDVFNWFQENRPKGTSCILNKNFPRFLYIEPQKVNPALMVAHIDTVWGDVPINPVQILDMIVSQNMVDLYNAGASLAQIEQDGTGIGADNRVGCFIISQLMGTGNGILLVDGEEIGVGSILISRMEVIQKAVHQHSFAIEFDRQSNSDLIFYNNENDKFRAFIRSYFKNFVDTKGSFSDIKPICEYRIPSVNVSCGYNKQHTPRENIVLPDVAITLKYAKNLLSGNWANIWNFR